MRKIIAALQVSLDGFIEGPHGELDWITSWEDVFDLLPQIDTCILGRVMYPGYADYWRAILADPKAPLPTTGQPPTPGEIEYARFADQTPHLVLSTTLNEVTWKNTRIIRDVEELRKVRQEPGKDMHAVGGAMLVSSLMNEGLIDEIRIVVQPIVLGHGKALFKDVRERHSLRLLDTKSLDAGVMRLSYGTIV